MLQKNAAALEELFAGMKLSGLPDFELLDPEIEFINFESFPLVQPYRGWDGVTAWLVDLSDPFDDFSMDLVDVLAEDNEHVVTICRATGRSRSGGPPFDMAWGVVWTFRNGKVTRAHGFRTGAEALEAVGLGE